MSEPTCVLCPVYRPEAEARTADGVCPADRARLERDLLAVPGLFAMLTEPPGAVGELRHGPVLGPDGAPTGRLHRDPVLADLPAVDVITARTYDKDSISGSRSAPVPINVDLYDLTAGARTADPLGPAADQIGHLPVATVLDRWVRYVRDCLHPDFHLPPDDVPSLVTFLHRHLEDTCRYLTDALPQLATALRQVGSAMRVLAQDAEPVPRPLLGLRCENCRHISTLVPWQTREYIECQSCGQLYSEAERPQLGKRQLAQVRQPRLVMLNGLLRGLAAG